MHLHAVSMLGARASDARANSKLKNIKLKSCCYETTLTSFVGQVPRIW